MSRVVMSIPAKYTAKFMDVAVGRRPNALSLPRGIGRPLALVGTDAHGEADRYLDALTDLPVFYRHIDLGDKLDRGPEPLAMNILLQVANAERLLGNHDAMWLAAGLGVPRIAIEQVRWLMRYNEEHFIENQMGINLKPLEEYANKYFGDYRGHFKSGKSKAMEAAATYLKIIAEAPYLFPQHRDTVLNASELRVRDALFHKNAFGPLSQSERDTFNRLTGKAELEEKDKDYFYRLAGGLKDPGPEGEDIIRHFVNEFRNNATYLQLVECMVGRGDIYTTLRMSQGAPNDILFTHAGIPLQPDGHLAEVDGLKGLELFSSIQKDMRSALFAWKWFVNTGDNSFLELHSDAIDRVGELAWGEHSPLYMRVMRTAARAVLEKESGLYEEPEGPFFSTFLKSKDPHLIHEVCRRIGSSFGLDPRRLLIVHGHKHNKDGNFSVKAMGHDLNIDAGAADNYGGNGAFLLIGTNSMYQFNFKDHTFRKIDLELEAPQS